MNGPTIKPPRATMGPETRSMMGKDRCSDGPLLRNVVGRRTTPYNVPYLAVALHDHSRHALNRHAIYTIAHYLAGGTQPHGTAAW